MSSPSSAPAVVDAAAPAPTFAELGVPGPMADALARQGITSPFDIQAATVPDALAGRDVLGRAPTGSGKTLAFGVPLVAQLGEAKARRPRGLILSPTRELAEQIRRELEPLARAMDRSILAIYGGVGFGAQLKGLRNGADLVVACPGRLQDLIDQGEISLDAVDQVVVDEADRMADMGFLPAVRAILDLTAQKRQTVLFSATLGREVKTLTDSYQTNPVTHEVGEVEPDLTTVEHRFILSDKEKKIGLAADLIDQYGPTMIFCRTRHGVDRVARQLKRAGAKAGWIHGGRSQNQRDAALHAFTAGKVQALVATDVAARGIHVDGVGCVIHYDPPADHKDYIHRSGRTARAGAGGVVVSFVNSDQKGVVKKLAKMVGLPPVDFEPMPELTVREMPTWVDQRPDGTNKNRNNARRSGGSTGGGHKGAERKSGERKNDGPKNRHERARPSSGSGSGSNRQSERSSGESRERRDDRSRPEQSRGDRDRSRQTRDDRPRRDSDDRPRRDRDDRPRQSRDDRPRRDSDDRAKKVQEGLSRRERARREEPRGERTRSESPADDADGPEWWPTTSKGSGRGPGRGGQGRGGQARGGQGGGQGSGQGGRPKQKGPAKAKASKRSGKPRPKNKKAKR